MKLAAIGQLAAYVAALAVVFGLAYLLGATLQG